MPGPNIIYLGAALLGAEKRIEICHDRAMTTIWLQLTNSEYIVNGGSGARFVTVLIGAVKQGANWVPIDAGLAACFRDVTIALGTSFVASTGRFQWGEPLLPQRDGFMPVLPKAVFTCQNTALISG